MWPRLLCTVLVTPVCANWFAAGDAVDNERADAAPGIDAWLGDSDAPLLSSAQLITYMPEPAVKTPMYAYMRFNLWPVVKRLVWGDPEHVETEPIIRDEQLNENDHYKLGEIYLWGLNGARNLTLAKHYFEKAGLEDGDPDALFRLAVMYSTGLLGAVEEDQAKAHLFYALAAEGGSIEAQIAMGNRYKNGLHVPVDHEMAHIYYSTVGERFLELQLNAYDEGDVPYTKTLKRSWTFGAEAGTGLYGKHSYRMIVTPAVRSTVALGDQSSAWQFVVVAFRDEFEDLNDAIDTLTYRADEENDTTAMYALARIYAAGIRVNDPDWAKAKYYSMTCNMVSQLKENYVPTDAISQQPKLVHSLCSEFVAERYLHGGEGFERDLNNAQTFYEQAIKLREQLPERLSKCSSCVTGLALVEWRKMGSPLQGATITALLQNALDQSKISNDYTLPVTLARMYLQEDNVYDAQRVLRRTVADSYGRAPMASLLLAGIDDPAQQLDRYVEGIYASEELVSPVRFAHYSYMRGDLDSAMIAFLFAAELGVPAAPLNLADLLDTRHSYLSSKLNWQWLKTISSWPIPHFVDKNRRDEYAFRYYMLAAKLDSVDGLMKAVEYDMAPRRLNLQYLRILASHGFGMAHWYLGHFYENVQHNFKRAAAHYRLAMATPEAWIPVKLSQLRLYYKAFGLPLPESSPHVQLSWSKAVQAYRLAFRSLKFIDEANDEEDARMAAEAAEYDSATPQIGIHFAEGTIGDGDEFVIELDFMWVIVFISVIWTTMFLARRFGRGVLRWLWDNVLRRIAAVLVRPQQPQPQLQPQPQQLQPQQPQPQPQPQQLQPEQQQPEQPQPQPQQLQPEQQQPEQPEQQQQQQLQPEQQPQQLQPQPQPQQQQPEPEQQQQQQQPEQQEQQQQPEQPEQQEQQQQQEQSEQPEQQQQHPEQEQQPELEQQLVPEQPLEPELEQRRPSPNPQSNDLFHQQQ